MNTTTDRIEHRAGVLLGVILAAALFVPATARAQSQTQQASPELWNRRLEIGPVAGLTTDWHLAPKASAVPFGATVLFRVRAPWTHPVIWTGAREIERTQAGTLAEHHFDTEGRHLVAVTIEGPHGLRLDEAVEFDVIRLHPTTGAPAGVLVSVIRLSADTVAIDPLDPNASSLEFLSRASAIAALRRLSDGHYETSTNRRLRLEADIVPRGFAPLIEWRLDGKPQRDLGPSIDLEVYTADEHILSAGPVADETQVRLDTYLVRITSHEQKDDIPVGTPVTFTAITEPPGYEQDITWLAATRYGTADPWMGEGPEFTVVFEGVAGPDGRIGVRADQPSRINSTPEFFVERIVYPGPVRPDGSHTDLCLEQSANACDDFVDTCVASGGGLFLGQVGGDFVFRCEFPPNQCGPEPICG